MESLNFYAAAVIACASFLLVRFGVAAWERHRLGDFGRILDPKNKVWLDELRLQIEENNDVVERLSAGARDQWNTDRVHSLRRLESACQILESVVQPNLGEMIEVLRKIARSLSLVTPPRPVAVAAYRLWQVRGWAGVNELLHWVVVTGRDRALVRLWFIRRALVVVIRTFLGTAVLAGRHGTWYATIDDAVADLGTTQRELVATAETIMAALDAWRARRGETTTSA